MDDDKNFQGAAPLLLGSSFAKQSKYPNDHLKAMRSSTKDHKSASQFFRFSPPNGKGGGGGWVQPKKRPQLPERRIHRPIGMECPPTETPVEQVNWMYTDSLKSMIIIQKRMLKSHIACQGIKCLQLTKPLAGRLAHYLQNWQTTTQDRWRCNQQNTGGLWSTHESMRHINHLKLLAATLAAQSFAKTKVSISILLRIDNTTAVTYINHLGGTASRELVTLTRDLWMWYLEWNIHITAQHLPGVQNTIADAESQSCKDRTDWKLNPVIFQKINQTFGPLETDLFASRLTTQCPHYFSWWPNPYATATDAFLQT